MFEIPPFLPSTARSQAVTAAPATLEDKITTAPDAPRLFALSPLLLIWQIGSCSVKIRRYQSSSSRLLPRATDGNMGGGVCNAFLLPYLKGIAFTHCSHSQCCVYISHGGRMGSSWCWCGRAHERDSCTVRRTIAGTGQVVIPCHQAVVVFGWIQGAGIESGRRRRAASNRLNRKTRDKLKEKKRQTLPENGTILQLLWFLFK